MICECVRPARGQKTAVHCSNSAAAAAQVYNIIIIITSDLRPGPDSLASARAHTYIVICNERVKFEIILCLQYYYGNPKCPGLQCSDCHYCTWAVCFCFWMVGSEKLLYRYPKCTYVRTRVNAIRYIIEYSIRMREKGSSIVGKTSPRYLGIGH